ncbi:MAG: metal-dependent hydrolase, partial [Planctomycetota bacterium]
MAVYLARHLMPMTRPPIENGFVRVVDGAVVEIGPWSREVSTAVFAEDEVIDLGNVVVLPGWVNAHTHLEFSDIPQPIG